MLIFMPLLYLLIMYLVQVDEQSGGQIEMMLYILLIVGMLQPLTSPLIARVQIQNWQKANSEKKNPASLFFSFALIRFSLIEAIYIYGLVVYFLSGDMTRALYFYPVGIVWSLLQWPTRERFENFVTKLSAE